MLKYVGLLIASILLNMQIAESALKWLSNNDIRTGTSKMTQEDKL